LVVQVVYIAASSYVEKLTIALCTGKGETSGNLPAEPNPEGDL
jgi:hypothetical protein